MQFLWLWWKVIAGVILPIGGIAAFIFLPFFALAIGKLLSTKGGRTIAIVAGVAWLLWMAFAIVEASAYKRGSQDQIIQINEQDQRSIEAARKARMPVAECYAIENSKWNVEEGLCELPATE